MVDCPENAGSQPRKRAAASATTFANGVRTESMNLYLVVVDSDYPDVLENVREQDRCEIRDDVWFVMSDVDTTSALAERLGIGPDHPGIVVSARFYSGVALSSVVEKLRSWEDD